MKKKVLLFLFFNYCLITLSQNNEKFLLFYLGGQSNMDGYGYNSKLPDSLSKTFEDVYIFHGNPVGDNKENGGIGNWAKLMPGHGTGFSSNFQNTTFRNKSLVLSGICQRSKRSHPMV